MAEVTWKALLFETVLGIVVAVGWSIGTKSGKADLVMLLQLRGFLCDTKVCP